MAYIQGKGALFKWHNGTSLQTIVQVEDITIATMTVPPVRFKATNAAAEVLVGAGVPSYGTVQFTMAWDPDDANHAAMYADSLAGTARASQVIFTNTGTAAYAWSTGIISSWAPQSVNADGLQKIQVTIDVGGETITP